jgi:hypothetical protein
MIVGVMKDQKPKLRILHTSHTLGSACKKNSKSSIGSHGKTGGTRPGQTCKTPKDLSSHSLYIRERGDTVPVWIPRTVEPMHRGNGCLLLFIINR